MIFALAGNQNSGKTTLFNELTGSKQHVGNFPGVTVEQKSGGIIGQKNVSLVDLPGIYSLSPYSSEEMMTRDFLIKQKPDGIINIVDATNIERNLYLTLQLIELQIPMVLALNMMDEVHENEGKIDWKLLSDELGIPVVPISAIKKDGIDELVRQAVQTAESRKAPERIDFCSGAVHRAIHAIAHLIEDHSQKIGTPMRFAATKLVEGDDPILKELGLTENEKDMVEHAVSEMEEELKTDREAALADMRYQFIEEICGKCVTRTGENKAYRRSIKIDSLLTHKYLGIPVFLAIMLTVFWLTFNVIGIRLSYALLWIMGKLAGAVGMGLEAFGMNHVMRSLIVDGVFAGVGTVMSFVPIIVTMFFFLAILEDTGYTTRVAFVMDKPLRKIGLSGRSFAPLLMGFGCTVPAVMAVRSLPGVKDKKITILLTPFMSCSAKLPIYAVFTAAFFPKYQALVMMSIYLAGLLLGIASGYIMHRMVFKGRSSPFVLELPNYRLPSAKTVLLLMWEKARDFLQRACTVILIAMIIVWFLQSFDIRFNPVEGGEGSMLAEIGKWISPIFGPLGFSDWRVATALITGFTSKEAVVGTLAVLTQSSVAELGSSLSALFTPLSAFSFLIFTLLYTPCVAAVATVKRELGSLSGTLLVILYQTGFAWVAAFIVYNIGRIMV